MRIFQQAASEIGENPGHQLWTRDKRAVPARQEERIAAKKPLRGSPRGVRRDAAILQRVDDRDRHGRPGSKGRDLLQRPAALGSQSGNRPLLQFRAAVVVEDLAGKLGVCQVPIPRRCPQCSGAERLALHLGLHLQVTAVGFGEGAAEKDHPGDRQPLGGKRDDQATH